mmetsp:Transcript_4580/g.7905  ORF Transcript_4580/g.7905 Transcript_4580/m.7905 type:complete len:130 (-) Transcript_4580:112-501(-)
MQVQAQEGRMPRGSKLQKLPLVPVVPKQCQQADEPDDVIMKSMIAQESQATMPMYSFAGKAHVSATGQCSCSLLRARCGDAESSRRRERTFDTLFAQGTFARQPSAAVPEHLYHCSSPAQRSRVQTALA